jgi:hypothetical protein
VLNISKAVERIFSRFFINQIDLKARQVQVKITAYELPTPLTARRIPMVVSAISRAEFQGLTLL